MVCIGFIFIALIGSPNMTEADRPAYNRAIKVCKERYNGCLKRFVRVEPLAYRAICADWDKE